jgi:hypothetical protein
LRISPDRAQPLKKLLAVADLRGDWNWSSDDNQIYVYRWGGYAGSATILQGETVTINADGTYVSRYVGSVNYNVVREQTSGTVELSPGRVVLREKGRDKTTSYHLISYLRASDGVTVMKLLPDQYEPEAGNVRYYSQKWIRK